VPADREAIESLLNAEGLPTDGLRVEDTLVAVDNATVVGAVALERFGTAAMLRSLVVAAEHRHKGIGFRLAAGALEVARWSGIGEVHVLTENTQRFFERFGFQSISQAETRQAVAESALVANSCCSTATAMRLDFEQADLPMLGKPSKKELPTFQSKSCC
jgi:N-acetylglutamate synthase-like GNAT family acetyltransferase